MPNIFNSVPFNVPKRNRFNLSHSVKTTCNQGELIPILMQDVIPADRMKLSIQDVIRLAPMIAPTFSEIDVQFHFFFVPNRIIWTQWEDFITQSHNGHLLAEDDLPQPPTISFEAGISLDDAVDSNAWTDVVNPSNGLKDCLPPLVLNTMADNLGFQTFPDEQPSWRGGTYTLDQMPFRACYKVWRDYFADENLQPEQFEPWDVSGDHAVTNAIQDPYVLWLMQKKKRSWKKDYFTSALPFAQKGDDVMIPGSSSSPLSATTRILSVDPETFLLGKDNVTASKSNMQSYHVQDTSGKQSMLVNEAGNQFVLNPSSVTLQTLIDQGSVGEGTIRELRRAIAAQKFLERRAIGGSRYVEQNLAFFGARSSDGRLQRAQFLGGYRQPVVVSQLLQTSETTQSSPLGTPAGNGVSAGSSYIFDKSFEEYGWIVGFMSIRPKADYLNGIPRKYLRKDIYDYYWPQFAHVGEQPIYNQELYFTPDMPDGLRNGTFGYTPRYAEYRFNNNRICGDFKGSLKFWTLGRDFDSLPTLNQQFITCNPSNRIFAVESPNFNHFWVDLNINLIALRPIPKYAESL